MALKAIITAEQFEALGKEVQAEYAAREGDDATGFMLQVEPVSGFVLEDVTGLKGALQKERSNVATLTAAAEGHDRALKPFEGLDAKAAREAIAKVKEWGDKPPKDPTVDEAMKVREAKLIEKHVTELAERDEKVKASDIIVRRVLVEQAATTALAKHKGDVELLLPHVKAFTTLEQDNGEPRVRVIGDDGQVRISLRPQNNEPMTMDELVGEILKDKYPSAYEGTEARGSGGGGSGGGGGGGGGAFTLTAEQARNPQEFQRVQAAATKAGKEVTILK